MTSLRELCPGATKKRPMITTRSQLGDIPRAWLIEIEPLIQRVKSHWLWPIADDRGNPIVRVRKVDQSGKRSYSHMSAYRFVANIFYDMPAGYFPQRGCKVKGCIRPDHILISPRSPAWDSRYNYRKGTKKYG